MDKFAAIDDGYVEFVGTEDEANSFAQAASSFLLVVAVPRDTQVGQRLDMRTLEPVEFEALTPEVITLPADKFDELERMLAEDPKPNPKLAALFARPTVFEEKS